MQDKLEYTEYARTLSIPGEGWDTIILEDKSVEFARINLKDEELASVSPGGEHLFTHEKALAAVKKLESRLPTRYEWESFCDNISVWDNVHKGRWFKCPSPNGFVDVFLPASGYRLHTSGAFYSTGSIGIFWSVALSGTSAYYMEFYPTLVRPALNLSRAYGFSVRCVRDKKSES
jgi:hypothetical protein